jgi:chromosome segregation ATPase
MRVHNSRAEHYKQQFMLANEENRSLKEQNNALREDISALRVEFEYSLKKIEELTRRVTTLEDELGMKDSIIKEKESAILEVNEEIEKFNSEFDKLIYRIEGKLKDGELRSDNHTHKAKREITSDKELLFGINIDTNFVISSSSEVLKYYLYTIDASKFMEYDLSEHKISKKRDLVAIGEDLQNFITKEAKLMGYDIEGLLEVRPADIFDTPKALFYVNDKKFVENLLSEFRLKSQSRRVEYSLSKEV